MAVKLIQPGGGYVVSDAQAARWAEEGRALRARRRLRDAEQEPVNREKLGGVVERLADRGRLRREQVLAALDIRAYQRGWDIAMLPKVQDFMRQIAGKAEGAPEPFLVTVRARRYRAWADATEAVKVRGELSALQVTLDLVLRDWAPWRLRAEYGISDVRALRVVQVALRDYALRAGWVEDREAA